RDVGPQRLDRRVTADQQLRRVLDRDAAPRRRHPYRLGGLRRPLRRGPSFLLLLRGGALGQRLGSRVRLVPRALLGRQRPPLALESGAALTARPDLRTLLRGTPAATGRLTRHRSSPQRPPRTLWRVLHD